MFPGAIDDREAAAYAIVGAPLDASTSFRPGTRFGPERIRSLARSFEDYDQRSDLHFSDCAVYDHGDVLPGSDVEDYLSFLRGVIGEYDDSGCVPLLVGGEHAVTIAALEAIQPDLFVCCDAHLDLREAYDGDRLSHATVTHHALEQADRAVILGARSGTEPEWERAADGAVEVVSPGEVRGWSPPEAVDEVYLSVDIDVVDPGFAPGTGTPEPFGVEPQAVHDVVRALAPSCIGFDVVEVNDRDDGQAALLGAKLLRAFVCAHTGDN